MTLNNFDAKIFKCTKQAETKTEKSETETETEKLKLN